MITQSELKDILHYDQGTGVFTWIKNSIVAGTVEKKGYIAIKINRKSYKAHRLAWLYIYGNFPKEQIDHLNGIKNDNCINNLREATASENMLNRKQFKNSSAEFKGISFHKKQQKWTAKIQINKQRIWLGSFYSASEAAIAYKNAAIKLHGNFVNFG